jgi:hypothetical protein
MKHRNSEKLPTLATLPPLPTAYPSIPSGAPPGPFMSKALTRTQNTEKRNQRICDAFYERYTSQPRPKLYTREYVISQLAEEHCLSMGTVENIIWQNAHK